jgi:putative ABC transport system permease protein
MKRVQAPRLAQRLFDWYCGLAKVEDLRGDMDEIFMLNVQRRGLFRARWMYWRQVLSLLTSYAVKARRKNAPAPAYGGNSILPLLHNYLVVGVRNLARQRYFTIINVAGLAIGMSISLLFITFFISVTDFDEFHANKQNIYRVITTRDDKTFASAPEPLAAKIKSELPAAGEVIRIGRFLSTSEPQPRQEVNVHGYFVDPSFLTAFTFPLVSGDPLSALDEPGSILLTQTTAQRVFASQDVVGKMIRMGAHGDFVIQGVLRDPSSNSHMRFDALASYSTIDALPEREEIKAWSNFEDHYLYLRLPEAADPSIVRGYLRSVSSPINASDPSHKTSFQLQALADINPGPRLEDQIGPQLNYLAFGIAGGLGLLILLPACFNYANISIARAMKRSKEIGLRKTMGGQRQHVFFQFMMETVIVALIALAGACLIFFVIRNEFKSMLINAASLDLSLNVERFLWFLVFAVVTGLIAGAIPAIHFSRLNPIEAMRNFGGKTGSGPRMREGLIVFQFALCLSFILSLILFTRQYRYAMNFDLGFTQENILDVELQQVAPENFAAEFNKIAAVQAVSMSSGIMGHGVPGTWSTMEGKSDSAETFFMYIDPAFIKNLDVELLAGRTFQDGEPIDRTVIVNESFLKRFGFNGPSDALGERVVIDTSPAEIIGVIRDFHYWQLTAPVAPFFFRYNPEKLRVANLKIVSNDIQATLLELDRSWRKVSDGRPFVANFLDDKTFGAFSMYISLLKIFGFLGLLAISISCLGLLGMVIFTAESKIKEVGIRKVMGASPWSITFLLSKGYLKLMLIASLFAIPVAFALDKFLGGLEHYRVAITPSDILLGLAIMFALGVGTMASQTLKAASANPAETLKYE